VSSFDALLIARSSVGLISLTGNQQIAGDVSGNGVVTAFDAGLVSQFAAQVVNHLPVATTSGSDWRFLQCAAYPSCTAPIYTYTPLNGPQTANFYAVLYGDVSGNWQKTGSLASPAVTRTLPDERVAIEQDKAMATSLAAKGPYQPVRRSGDALIYVERASVPVGRTLQRNVFVSGHNASGIQGLDLEFDYDPATTKIVNVKAVDQDSGYNAIWNDDGNGSLHIAFYGFSPLNYSGRLVQITMQPSHTRAAVAPRLTHLRANEGAIPSRIALPPAVIGNGGTGVSPKASATKSVAPPVAQPRSISIAAPAPAQATGGVVSKSTTAPSLDPAAPKPTEDAGDKAQAPVKKK
jgi:hypothetical protein